MDGAGATIRQARLAQGMTQAELARRMGITQPSVARIEAAGDHVTMATLKRAVAAMDRSITLIVGAPPDIGIDESLLHSLIGLEPAARLERFESVYTSAREIAEAGAAARALG